jgi:hypothetical protein
LRSNRYIRYKSSHPKGGEVRTRDLTRLIGLAILAVALFFIAIGIATT